MNPDQQMKQVEGAVGALVDQIKLDDLYNATPCDQFTVHDLLDHLIVGATSYAYLLRGDPVPELKAPPVYGRVPAAEFHGALEALVEAMNSDGAMHRRIETPAGELDGADLSRLLAFDVLIHGWDLANATGLPFAVHDDVVTAVDDFIRASFPDQLRDGDTFKDATEPPPGATPLEALVALSGRSV